MSDASGRVDFIRCGFASQVKVCRISQVLLLCEPFALVRHGEGLGFVTAGRSPSQDISHTLDLCGAALATSLVAQGVGDVPTANSMMKLTGNFVNVYDKQTGLLLNGKDDAYYEGTFWNYSFRQLPE